MIDGGANQERSGGIQSQAEGKRQEHFARRQSMAWLGMSLTIGLFSCDLSIRIMERAMVSWGAECLACDTDVVIAGGRRAAATV